MENAPNPTTVKEPLSEDKQTRLVDVPIVNEATALNVIVSFVGIAQQRGVFNLEESSKIWECIQKFRKV